MKLASPPPRPADTLLVAAAQHRAGQLGAAERLYRKVLKDDPNQPDALNLLGVIHHQRGHPDRAVQLIRRALRVNPMFPEALTNLARAQRDAGDRASALESARQAVALAPRLAEAQVQLGRGLLDVGEYQAAANACRAALAESPGSLDAWVNLGAALTRLEQWPEAAKAYRQAHELNPTRVETLIDFACALRELHLFQDALRCTERAAALAPADPLVHAAHAQTLKQAQDPSGAADACRRALALAPGRADFWVMLGSCLSALGRFTEAAAAHQRALALAPESAEAKRGLVVAGQLSADEAELHELRRLADDASQPAPQRIAAGFAAGRLLDKAGSYDLAFAAYIAANSLAKAGREREGRSFDRADLQRTLDRIIASFSAEAVAAAHIAGNPDETPVFIVGMPRSGTTLIEQIAASHARVFGAGERHEMAQIVNRIAGRAQATDPRAWDPALIGQEAASHLALLRGLAGPADRVAERVIDKMPDNIFWVGAIAVLFPRARIVLARRDLRDVCLSCFFQRFSADMAWSHDLSDLAFRARQVERLVAHWRTVLPSRLLELQYETLVTDLEGQSRRLIDFLGLDWDPACLAFHETERPIMTASLWQVRQPIYSESVGRWQRYRPHLAPLLDGLADLVGDVASDLSPAVSMPE